ncbi:class I SAM-dependent methyltransferase [Halorussus salilacus]|uniref:class I SAM-dependent methyltransferase n=1 Tax=Halorussus salilacus TaxID=2953750 RepID=UPI00209E447B|nr:class I SAM-dependent methyltransferase [Halorussus salilacus]USZ67807.1 class I SAM-dependent methyltransferase [Halorussus salilacus]
MTDMDPGTYYDEFAEGEWERLDRDPVTRMEFENTTDYLAEFLPDSGRVLDAGGGPGRYTCWLAERGYEVEHCDLSAEQVAIAREKVAERGLGDRATCQRGDLRDLPFADDAFDAVCCLGGPLSHVVDDAERADAMAELRRVARGGHASEASEAASRESAGAPAFVSVIGRFAMLRDVVQFSLEDAHGLLAPIAEDGDYTAERVEKLGSGEGWAECHGFRADEFEAELEDAGFDVDRLVGLENVATRTKRELADADEAALDDVREVVRTLREDRTAVDFSEHMLAVCRA